MSVYSLCPFLNVVVQSLRRVRLFVTPWVAARQASLSITISWSLLKFMSTELGMPSSHLILCRPLLLLPSTFPSIRVFSNESSLPIRWPKNWSFSFNISPSNEYSGLISFRMDWFDLLEIQGTLNSVLYYCWPVGVFYVFCIQILYQTYDLKITSSILQVVFSLFY